MYENWAANAAVVSATGAAVVCSVLVHYEGLVQTFGRLFRLRVQARVKVLLGILAVIALHVVEIWIFGLALWLLLRWPECGSIAGAEAGGLLDAVYLSAVSFTTVGFGDLAPVGAIRFLSATESLIGFVLIAWSASFTYLEMERFWRRQ